MESDACTATTPNDIIRPVFLHWLTALLCAVGVPTLWGCGHDGRVPLQGTVTLDGQTLNQGTIQFRPLAGTNGPTAGAQVVAGKFLVPAQGAPFAGKFRVEITSSKLTGRKIPNPMGNGTVDECKQYLPARYNTASELQAEVAASGDNNFDFQLESDRKGSL